MCGIIGYCGPKPAAPILIEGLKRLEYRGYDSAGIAVGADEGLHVHKREGKLFRLRERVPEDLGGIWGIGHTRWATHGEVNDLNAHPHTDATNTIAVVHNGIIENFTSLKEKLQEEGYVFRTETDSEVIAHLIASLYDGDLETAVRQTARLLKGTYGILAMHAAEPNVLVGARNGSPLVLGVGNDEMFMASDATALVAHTKQVVYIEDGEVVKITPKSYKTTDLRSREIDKKVDFISWELEEIEKGGFAHFMEKEILEQSESIKRAMQGRLDLEYGTGHLGGLNMANKELLEVERVKIIAAGTSLHAGMVAAYLLETVARIPAQAELASELRYRNPVVERNNIYFAVSQSGETADTLYAMRELKRKGARVLGICNVVGATIPRESDGGVYIHSGPEIAVASTKAFTSQMTALYLFALIMARMRHMSLEHGLAFIKDLEQVPDLVAQIVDRRGEIELLAKKYAHAGNFLFLGRGINYPVALEGALKLKEISYEHAEGFPAGELKHGPLALVTPQTPVFAIDTGRHRAELRGNVEEVQARDAPVVALAPPDSPVAETADRFLPIPETHPALAGVLANVQLQLVSYHTARLLDRAIDKPRNLAKSVTVQ